MFGFELGICMGCGLLKVGGALKGLEWLAAYWLRWNGVEVRRLYVVTCALC